MLASLFTFVHSFKKFSFCKTTGCMTTYNTFVHTIECVCEFSLRILNKKNLYSLEVHERKLFPYIPVIEYY